MNIARLFWEEAQASWTLGAFATLCVAALAGRLRGRKTRTSTSAFFFALHVVLLVVTAALMSSGQSGDETRMVARVLLVVAWSGAVASVIFELLLPFVRVHVPRIVQDIILVGGAAVASGIVLAQHGVALSGLFATSALVTAVVGLSLQDTLGNTIGGIALQLDGSLRVGDWVKVGDVSGRVKDIRWRTTSIETRNWETVLVPNSQIVKGAVTIVGRREGAPEQVRRWVKFNVDFRYAPKDVMDAVVGALRAQPLERVATDPPPDCILHEFHDSFAIYAVRYWLTDIAADDPTDSLVRTRILVALKRAGIPLSIPAYATFQTDESKKRKEAKSERERHRRISALQDVSLFAPLDDDELGHLADALHEAPFVQGEVITRQGADAHWLYVLVEGSVVIRVAKNGVEHDVAQVQAPSFFGEMSLLTGEKRSATVVATTDVVCYRLEKEAFQALVQRRPEVAHPIAALLAERQASLEKTRADLDDEARAKRLADDSSALLRRMKSFLGFA